MKKENKILLSVVLLVFVLLWVAYSRVWGDPKKSLCSAVAQANRITIERTWFGLGGKNEKLPPPFEIIGVEKVSQFMEQIEFSGMKMQCKCVGDFYFKFYKDDTLQCEISYHHSSHYRWNKGPWMGDAVLTSKSRGDIYEWLKKQGYDLNKKPETDSPHQAEQQTMQSGR